MLAFNSNIVGGNVISTRIGKCRKPNSQSSVECYPNISSRFLITTSTNTHHPIANYFPGHDNPFPLPQDDIIEFEVII